MSASFEFQNMLCVLVCCSGHYDNSFRSKSKSYWQLIVVWSVVFLCIKSLTSSNVWRINWLCCKKCCAYICCL